MCNFPTALCAVGYSVFVFVMGNVSVNRSDLFSQGNKSVDMSTEENIYNILGLSTWQQLYVCIYKYNIYIYHKYVYIYIYII